MKAGIRAWKFIVFAMAIALAFRVSVYYREEGDNQFLYNVGGILGMGLIYHFGKTCYNDGKKDRR